MRTIIIVAVVLVIIFILLYMSVSGTTSTPQVQPLVAGVLVKNGKDYQTPILNNPAFEYMYEHSQKG